MDSVKRLIELHDSKIEAITEIEDQIIVFMQVYIHKTEERNGQTTCTGWGQVAAIAFTQASIEGEIEEFPIDVSSGKFKLDGEVYSNLMPIVVNHTGAVELDLTMTTSEMIMIRGAKAVLTLLGDEFYIDDCPDWD